MLWDKLTVDEHFELFAWAYELKQEASERAEHDLLEELQFDRYRAYRVEDLSGGTRQKLNLALALMHEPQLLLLDEPYSGFDWETYVRFWEMSERRRDEGMGILIVSHLLTERQRLDRLYTLVDGKAVRRVTALAAVGGSFVREHLRTPLTLALLVAIPVFFVLIFASVLGEFAEALGGTLAGSASTAISAGWAAAFLCGTLAFFQVASSRSADRRLALAGLGAGRVALARIAAAIVLGIVVSAIAYLTLWLRSGIEHPAHAAVAVFAFAADLHRHRSADRRLRLRSTQRIAAGRPRLRRRCLLGAADDLQRPAQLHADPRCRQPADRCGQRARDRRAATGSTSPPRWRSPSLSPPAPFWLAARARS